MPDEIREADTMSGFLDDRIDEQVLLWGHRREITLRPLVNRESLAQDAKMISKADADGCQGLCWPIMGRVANQFRD